MEPLTEADPGRIGAYVLVARLGAGGMGQVYLGRSPGGRLVAVKVVRGEVVGHPEALARFRREVETVRAVRSAYTASLIDASLEEAPYWLATEYVAGPTLAEAVRGRGPLGAGTCRGVAAALAEGLASVHAYGVTHRDLKPQNVILGAQGPQLIDFGIARGIGSTALTQAGQAPGTPGYTAPEVLLGAVAGAAADVFALGATLAYAATGRPPYGAGAAAGIGYRTVHEPVDLAGVEPGLAALIESCVAKDPAARPGPAEVIRRCGVRGALVEDPGYGAAAPAGDPAGGGATRAWAGPLVPMVPMVPMVPLGLSGLPVPSVPSVPSVLPGGGTTVPVGTGRGGSGRGEDGGPGASPGAATRAWPEDAPPPGAAAEAGPREPGARREPAAGTSAEASAYGELPREGEAPAGPPEPERGAPAGARKREREAGGAPEPECEADGGGASEREHGTAAGAPEPECEADGGGASEGERGTDAGVPGPERGTAGGTAAGGEGRSGVFGAGGVETYGGRDAASPRAGAAPARWARRAVAAVLLAGVGAGGVWAVGRADEWAHGARASETGAPGAGAPGAGALGTAPPGTGPTGTAPTGASASAPAGTGAPSGKGTGKGGGRKAVDYRWKLSTDPLMAEYGAGDCARPAEGTPPGGGIETQTVSSHRGGVPSTTATVRMRPKPAGGGAGAAGGAERPRPYPVRVAVRPPGAQPPADGGPAGFLSAPVDLYSGWDSGDYVELTYPDDFPGAVPLAADRGDWTVVFYRVEDGAGTYEGISCSGFNVAR
ncbi:protein kinase [Streptomyces sp. NPDC002044]|uniref:serine/threonine-protein kinase n=1 Tax=Streptomyces sp. NPDC002044 TaxID=3154662 RepID=UPI00332E596B